MRKLYVGLVGESGAGKGTVANIIKLSLAILSVGHITFSSILHETLEIYGLPFTTDNLQRIIVVLEREFGPGLLSRAIRKRAIACDQDVVILDGVRWPTDLSMLRSLENNLLIYVTAELGTRYIRLKARKEKVGEDVMSWNKFVEEQSAENELKIPIIGNQYADVKITNNDSQLQLESKIVELAKKYIIERKRV